MEPYTANGDFTYDPQIILGNGPTAPCPGTDGLVQGASAEFRTAGTIDNGTKTCQLIRAKTIALPAPITAVSDDTDPLTNPDGKTWTTAVDQSQTTNTVQTQRATGSFGGNIQYVRVNFVGVPPGQPTGLAEVVVGGQ